MAKTKKRGAGKGCTKQFDMFGHTIALNFNQEGNTHQTGLGGCVSLLVYLLFLFYMGLNIARMMTYQNDEVSLHSGLIETEAHPVLYNETRMKLFYALRNQRDFSKQVLLDEELSTYLDFKFKQAEDNWYLPHDEGRFKHVEYPAKQCTQDDFGHDSDSVKYFEAWAGITLLCPDLKDGEHLMLEGESSSMQIKHFLF